MEKENDLIDRFNLDVNDKKQAMSFQFWLHYLKKSWPIYIIMIFFTTLFVILYVISENIYQFYAAIFYPIIMLLILVGEGVYKNIIYLRTLEKEFKTVQVDIFSTHLTLTNTIKGINHISELPYNVMENIYYVPESGKIVFEVRKNNSLIIEKKDVKQETFDFLTTLIAKEFGKQE